MSGFGFKRKKSGLDKLLGIRARLALLALILVAPLMLERAHSLEEARNKQIALAYSEFARLAQHSADSSARSRCIGRDRVEIGGSHPGLQERFRSKL